MCALQNIALRGHRNEVGCKSVNGVEPEENDENFRALLRYRIRGGDNQLASFGKMLNRMLRITLLKFKMISSVRLLP